MPLPHYTENGMIQVHQLNFYYGRQHVLHDIDLHLTRGSITGLIGPNGVGKSTLMRCLAGLEVPSDGEVLLNGQLRATGLPARHLRPVRRFDRDSIYDLCRQSARRS